MLQRGQHEASPLASIAVASARQQTDKEGTFLHATIAYSIKKFLPSLVMHVVDRLQHFDSCK